MNNIYLRTIAIVIVMFCIYRPRKNIILQKMPQLFHKHHHIVYRKVINQLNRFLTQLNLLPSSVSPTKSFPCLCCCAVILLQFTFIVYFWDTCRYPEKDLVLSTLILWKSQYYFSSMVWLVLGLRNGRSELISIECCHLISLSLSFLLVRFDWGEITLLIGVISPQL